MNDDDRVKIGHGGGGRIARRFLETEILPRFGHPAMESLDDGATLEIASSRIVFTTDGFVLSPPIIPGTDLGKLAICGTVNDLAVSGAAPRYISLAAIIEEGFSMSRLGQLLDSAARAAHDAGVHVVCGDTKVVSRAEADGIFLTTAGIGVLDTRAELGTHRIVPGDSILVSGTVGDHGAAVLCAREKLGVREGPVSDCAPVSAVTDLLLEQGEDLKFMRDPTRGGLIATVHELVAGARLAARLDEASIPLAPAVRTICELVGLEPMLLASEGRVVAVVSDSAAPAALEALRQHPESTGAAIIGTVESAPAGRVLLETTAGTSRVVLLPEEDPLPRIC